MKILKLIPILFFVVYFSACSAIAAFSGSKDPQMDKVTIGQSKEVINQELGLPIENLEDNSFLYQYKVGDEPSPARGLMHTLLDLCTFCLWEYIGFPIEISKSGNSYKMQIAYDKNDTVKKITKIK